MKVLVVAPYYAPYSLVGAQRINSFVSYLAKKNHVVTVVTYSLNYIESFGQSALKAEIPDFVRVVRVDVGGAQKSVTKRNRIFECAFQEQLDVLLSNELFDVCLVTVGPFFTLNAVRSVMNKHGIPFYIDYRDLISMGQNGGFIKYVKSLRSAINMHITNKKCITAADGIVTVSETCKNVLSKKYNVSPDYSHVIYNGFDESQLQSIPHIKWVPKTKYSVGYFGKFMYYEEKLGIIILNAISKLRENGCDIAFYHIGPAVNGIEGILKRNNIGSNCYVHLGSKAYATGISYLKKMDCCAIEWKSTFGLGTKVFDYIYVNKPVIGCMGKDTELGQFLSKFENAIVSESEFNIAEFLKRIIANNITNLDKNLSSSLYSREKQNEELEKILMGGGARNAKDG